MEFDLFQIIFFIVQFFKSEDFLKLNFDNFKT